MWIFTYGKFIALICLRLNVKILPEFVYRMVQKTGPVLKVYNYVHNTKTPSIAFIKNVHTLFVVGLSLLF